MKSVINKLTLFTVFLLLVSTKLGAVDTLYYYFNDFETVETDSTKWISTKIVGTQHWEYAYGGNESNPITSKSGSWNALFHWGSLVTSYSAFFESPKIDLNTAEKPLLSFWHAMGMADFGLDEVYLLFKAGSLAPWDTIEYFDQATGDEYETYWEERNYNLDEIDSLNPQKYLVEDFQMGFIGISNGGHGVCIDSIVIAEKDTISKFVRKFESENVDYDLIPSGATTVPLTRVDLEIMGNDGSALLHSIEFTSESTSDALFQAGSFELYLSRSSIFSNKEDDESTLLASGESISGGLVEFTGLSKDIPIGFNYLWLVADVSTSATWGDEISFSIGSNAISINDTLLPATASSPEVTNVINESIFFDGFETDLGWTYDSPGDWERANPLGLVKNSSKDPFTSFAGSLALGTDLTDDGVHLRRVSDSISAYYVTTPTINLKYYNRIRINFHDWTSIFTDDRGVIEMSNDNGVTWTNIWKSEVDATAKASRWTERTITDQIADSLSRKEQVKLRFGITKSGTAPYIGFNIDNFAVVGNHIETDVAVTEILSPFDDCLGFGNDTVIATFKNNAEGSTPTRIPVYYGIWGIDTILVRDTIEGAIPQDGSVTFKFATLANFPQPDLYDKFIVGVDVSGDEDLANDTLTKPLRIQESINPAHFENFEFKGGIWSSSENSTWLAKVPDASIGSVSGSPNAWVLSPFGSYINSDTSFIASGCYDLTGANRYIIQIKYWLESEVDQDGFSIEYSTDDEVTWNLVDTSQFGRTWGWYTDSVATLGQIGWSGNSAGWTAMHELLPASLASEPKVKFRVLWASDDINNARGLAIDDFEIFPAPTDIGASDIVSPVDACQGANPTTVTVRVENFGYNRMLANDTVIIGVEYKKSTEPTYSSPFIDTLILGADLLPGNTVDLVVNSDIDISDSVTYDIRAYTLIEDDPWYYLANNDTFNYSFNVWPNPVIELIDTIGSYQPDTVVIVPEYKNWKSGYSYSWTPGSITDSTYDVAANGFGDGIYKITATEPTNLCSTTDSVNVLLLYSDAGVDSILSPHTSCELSDSEIIQVRVRNMGTDSIKTNSKIVVGYQVEGDVSVYRDTITLSGPLNAGQTFLHSFNDHPYDFSVPTIDYTIHSWGYVMSSDSISSNDTTTKVLTVYGYSPLDLGADTIVKGLNLTLDAGPGFVSYIWNDDVADNLQTKLLDASAVDYTQDTVSGEYTVYVEDANGCAGADTINVWFKIRDVLADTLTAPITSCERVESDNIIKLRIRNNGSDTILTTDIINYSYAVNGGGAVIENIVPSSNINPGGLYEHSFATTYDFSAYTTYSVALSATTAGDLHTSNDNIVNSITTNPNPVVDFGVIPDPIFQQEYILDAGSGSYTYLWQDATTTTQTYTATSSGTYGVVVTNPVTGCVGGDTADLTFVIVDFAMFGIEDIDDDNRICPQVEDAVIVTVFNLGNQVLTNATLNVGYRIGAETPVYEEITVGGAWGAGDPKVLEFSELVSFDNSGRNKLTAFINETSDINSVNDSTFINVDVDVPPLVDFGGDTLQVGIPHILDAGEHQTYEWNDGWDGQEYTVSSTTSQSYWVTVSDAGNSCLTTKSVWIEPTLSSRSVSSENLDLNLYPNPASEFLNIVAKDLTGKELYVEIYSITNQLIWADHHDGYGAYNHKLDISSFNEGVYLLRVRNSKINHVQRFIVH